MAALVRASDQTIAEVLPWLETQAHKLAPKILYGVAERLLTTKPQDAPFWWLIGTIRLSYDAARCTDRSVGAIVGKLNFMFRREVRRKGLTNLKLSKETIQSALAFDIENPPHNYSLIETCGGGMRGIGVGLKQNGAASKTPRDTQEKRVPSHVGRVVKVPQPQISDPFKWTKTVSEHAAILKKIRNSYRNALNRKAPPKPQMWKVYRPIKTLPGARSPN